jgi:GNAT superfamily N-acetyltransferase
LVEIALVNHSDKIKPLVNLFSKAFRREMPEELWRWKYLQNPSFPVDREVVVALDRAEIVGARPFMLAKMWLGNKEVDVAQHCDTMVHPDYQRQGIFNKMGKFALRHLEDKGFAFSYGFPGPLSRRGFKSQGYQPLATKEIMFKLINPRKLFDSQVNNKLLNKSLSFLYRGYAKFKKKKPPKKPNLFQLELYEKVDEEMKEVFSLRNKPRIDLVRNKDYLQWRFDNHPKHHYTHVLLKSDDRLNGYAVLSVQKRVNNLLFGTIVDHVVNGSDTSCYRALMTQCLEILEKQECDILVVSAIGEPELKRVMSRDFGFNSSIAFPYNKFFPYDYIDVIKIGPQPADCDIYNRKNWHVTHAFQDEA